MLWDNVLAFLYHIISCIVSADEDHDQKLSGEEKLKLVLKCLVGIKELFPRIAGQCFPSTHSLIELIDSLVAVFNKWKALIVDLHPHDPSLPVISFKDLFRFFTTIANIVTGIELMNPNLPGEEKLLLATEMVRNFLPVFPILADVVGDNTEVLVGFVNDVVDLLNICLKKG